MTSRPKVHRLPAAPRNRLFGALAALPPRKKIATIGGISGTLLLSVVALALAATGRHAPENMAQAELIPAAGAAETAEKSMIFSDKEGTIVGQMAKIPPENEQAADIKSMREVDKKAGRDLLSVINKY